jgi:SET domain-containing protein
MDAPPQGLSMEDRQEGDLNLATGPVVAQTDMILFKSSPIHGTGGFARRTIRGGTHIIEYVGERISKAEAMRRCEANNAYIFTLNDEHDLDGNVEWNPARFLNHSCAPNCEAEKDEDRIWIIATRDIQAGEEITFNYGYDLEEYKDFPCRCGSPQCVGYMVAEEFFEHVLRRKAQSL